MKSILREPTRRPVRYGGDFERDLKVIKDDLFSDYYEGPLYGFCGVKCVDPALGQLVLLARGESSRPKRDIPVQGRIGRWASQFVSEYDPVHFKLKFLNTPIDFSRSPRRWEHVQAVVESEEPDGAVRLGDWMCRWQTASDPVRNFSRCIRRVDRADSNWAKRGIIRRVAIPNRRKAVGYSWKSVMAILDGRNVASATTQSANAGVPLAVVQSIVGHATAEMTRHYYHESQGALVAAVTALPDVVKPGTGTSPSDAVTPRVKALCAALDALDAQERKWSSAACKAQERPSALLLCLAHRNQCNRPSNIHWSQWRRPDHQKVEGRNEKVVSPSEEVRLFHCPKSGVSGCGLWWYL